MVMKTIERGFQDQNIRRAISKTAESYTEIDVAVPDSTTDLQVDVTIDYSQVKLLYLESDKALTVETNSGSTPDDTITLVAAQPYIYVEGDYHTLIIGTDVTALFLTNASGATANFKLRVLADPTV
jgi:hypothetical protein